MHRRFVAAGVLLALTAGCAGGAGGSTGTALPAPGGFQPDSTQSQSQPTTQTRAALASSAVAAASSNVVSNPGFETGSLSPWTSCGSITADAKVVTTKAHSGTHSAFIGTHTSPELNGTAGVCQTVTVPTGGTLTFWVYEATTDTIQYVDQEADIRSTSGTQIAQLYSEAKSTGGWVQKTFSLSSYAGQTVQLYFGVKGNGYASAYVNEFLDDVSLTGSGPTPTPSPTPTPCASCTPTPPPTPTPTPTLTPPPTPTPSATPYPCSDSGFITDQQKFASGQITADQLVDVCGQVTKVLPSKVTSSGKHGYFYVSIPGSASPGTIEIVSNLDAMAQAPTDQPPTTWPWVSVGQYVYVQGRYYYDNASSQGIDWTEDDTGSWPDVGWVVVCTTSTTGCNKYW